MALPFSAPNILYSTPPICPTVPSSSIVPVPAIVWPFVKSFFTSWLYISSVVINPPDGPDSLLLNFISTFGVVLYSFTVWRPIPNNFIPL